MFVRQPAGTLRASSQRNSFFVNRDRPLFSKSQRLRFISAEVGLVSTHEQSKSSLEIISPIGAVKPRAAHVALSPETLFASGGELGALMQKIDWPATPLGPIDAWPQSLITCVRIILTSRQPMFIWWGDELINLYNDPYRSILGGKHPAALGMPARKVWSEIWDQVAPRAESALRNNEGTYDESLLLIMERNGYKEETYYTFSYSPVPNDDGQNQGIICANTENTAQIMGERRVALLRELASVTGNARSSAEACRLGAAGLGSNPKDICFALIYTENKTRDLLELCGRLRVEPGHQAAPSTLRTDENTLWPIHSAMQTHEVQIVRDLGSHLPPLSGGFWNDAPQTAAVVPLIAAGGTGKSGVLIVGLNPFCLADDNYIGFLKLVAGQISASIANAEAYEQERRRAEALAELDRAKTTFFSNVSHEFRTPLTLMLGPLEDLLGNPLKNIGPGESEQLELVHRNSLRLLRMVNTLLDFSRIEADRIQANYSPVDLAARTEELASLFRAAMERAGLEYIVKCESLPEDVFIDLEMWEKIVLNLLSNAFKFTLEGKVEVTLRAKNGFAELCVVDTGAGIPEHELPRIFERFHRIEGSEGRTHEGTGIGLALVDELVRLHGGTVNVKSSLGKGTTFQVFIPFGSDHLPPERISRTEYKIQDTMGAAPFVQEALRWLPDAPPQDLPVFDGPEKQELLSLESHTDSGEQVKPRIVLADDNRDMREYVQRLLSREYDVSAVCDGAQALAEVLSDPPDLVLTDVMMPKLDGFALLNKLRENAATATIPVIVLSARAGEEAQSEGLEAGADDYLVKPFTARELLARVNAHVSMYRLRTVLMKEEHELRKRAEEAELRYRTMLESISEGFVFIDRDWKVRYANERWSEYAAIPLPDAIGHSLWELFPGLAKSDFGIAYKQVMETGVSQRAEHFYPQLGRWFQVSIFAARNGISIFALDVTDQHRQRERLMLTEKLAATGRLAATIAHEINNPLESVLNLIYLARTSRFDADKIQQYLTTAEKEITRVSHIARHTLGFYRDTSMPTQIEAQALLDEVLTVYESRLRAAGIKMHVDCRARSMIKGLRGELHQVLSNLISNAIDAITDHGEMWITVEDRERDGKPFVYIEVRDNGKGIPRENLARLFEPFFTTKPNSGTGLGLWVVKQFVDSWGGLISVESTTEEDSHGTTFELYVPLVALSRQKNVDVETAQTSN